MRARRTGGDELFGAPRRAAMGKRHALAKLEGGDKDAKFGLMKTREGYFRKSDHQMMHEMYTVQALPAAEAKNKYDIFRSSPPVPAANESLEVIATTAEENECKMA